MTPVRQIALDSAPLFPQGDRTVRLRQARFEDHAAIAALETSQGLKSKPFEEWRRLWTHNPCYNELGSNWPIGWVLEERGGRVVGSLGNVPLPYVFQRRKILAATGRGWSVEQRYRGFAPLLMDEYFSQPNVDLFLNTSVNGNAESAFGAFGSLRVPAGDWGTAAFIVTGYRGFAESALRIKGIPQPLLLSYPAGVALSIHDLLSSKRIPSCDADVVQAHGFDEAFDTFWEALEGGSPALLAVRSREVLNWHFSAALERNQLWIFTVLGRGGIIQAYGIFEQRDEPQYHLKRMRLVDFQALNSHAGYEAAILRRALAVCRARGIHALEHVGCDLQETRVFDRAALHRRKLPAWSYCYLAPDPALASQLSNPAVWAPSCFDGDSSL